MVSRHWMNLLAFSMRLWDSVNNSCTVIEFPILEWSLPLLTPAGGENGEGVAEDSGGARPMLMAGRRQVISRSSKSSQNILM